MAKNEEENTGYITQSTRHSMLVSLSREINVISDENAVLYDTIIELCKKFFPEKNNQKFCAQCKIMEKGAYAPNPIDDPTTPYIESHILRLEMLATGNMELKDQIVKMCRLLLEEKDNDKGNDRSKTLFTIFDTPENAPKLWNRRTYCYQAERAVQDMTAEKAIEVLNKIGEETNIEDILKNLSNSNIFTALKLAVHALEKQVAKKLKEVIRTSSNKKSRVKAFEHNYNHQNWQDQVPIPEYKEWQWTDYQCPICNALIKEGRPEFCWRCGQAFDWSDETESENNEKRDNS